VTGYIFLNCSNLGRALVFLQSALLFSRNLRIKSVRKYSLGVGILRYARVFLCRSVKSCEGRAAGVSSHLAGYFYVRPSWQHYVHFNNASENGQWHSTRFYACERSMFQFDRAHRWLRYFRHKDVWTKNEKVFKLRFSV